MSETLTRQQVNAIVAPLEAEIRSQEQRLAELEAENAILRQFMRTCDLQAAEIAMENSHE